MVVAKSQRGIKAGSMAQQNEVQWQRARAETLRTEERSVRMHKERLAPYTACPTLCGGVPWPPRGRSLACRTFEWTWLAA